MRASVFLLLFLIVALPVSACGSWGTMEEAEKIYRNNKTEFHNIRDVLSVHPELRHITPAFSPAKGNMEYNKQYSELTEASQITYGTVLARMKLLGVRRIRIWSFARTVEFWMFGRGIGGDTEGIVVKYKPGAQPLDTTISPGTFCKQIDGPEWYVCHVQ